MKGWPLKTERTREKREKKEGKKRKKRKKEGKKRGMEKKSREDVFLSQGENPKIYMYIPTSCPRSYVHFYIASYCTKRDKTSWPRSITKFRQL